MLVEGGGVILSQALIKKDHKSGVEVGLCGDDILAMKFKFRHESLADLRVQATERADEVCILGGIIVEESGIKDGCIGCH